MCLCWLYWQPQHDSSFFVLQALPGREECRAFDNIKDEAALGDAVTNGAWLLGVCNVLSRQKTKSKDFDTYLTQMFGSPVEPLL